VLIRLEREESRQKAFGAISMLAASLTLTIRGHGVQRIPVEAMEISTHRGGSVALIKTP
jgi:hypothetical protein